MDAYAWTPTESRWNIIPLKPELEAIVSVGPGNPTPLQEYQTLTRDEPSLQAREQAF